MDAVLCGRERILRSQKKVSNVSYRVRDLARDALVDRIFRYYHIDTGLMLYQLLTLNPLDVVIGILSAKFGVSKIIITIILAFLL